MIKINSGKDYNEHRGDGIVGKLRIYYARKRIRFLSLSCANRTALIVNDVSERISGKKEGMR